jgi:GGDEF domain-containing protein
VRNESAEHPERDRSAGTEADRLERAARGAQQLCDALWEALHEELRDPSSERIVHLSLRLAEVSSSVALLAGGATGEARQSGGSVLKTSVGSPLDDPATSVITTGGAPAEARLAPVAPSAPAGEARLASASDREPRLASAPSVAPDPEPSEPPAVERRTPPAPSRPDPLPPDPPSLVAVQPIPTRAGEYTFTKLVDERGPVDAAERLASVAPIQPEIEIHDVRHEEGPSAWVSSVGRLLARHAEDGLPFAVLLVEIVDVARLERAETPHDLHGMVSQVESALGRAMRSTDELSRETRGRYWLVAPETNGTGARMLAERLARLVRGSATHRGVPLEVAVGIAVCPDDGTEAPALAARADLGVYSARATGRSIAHTDPPA